MFFQEASLCVPCRRCRTRIALVWFFKLSHALVRARFRVHCIHCCLAWHLQPVLQIWYEVRVILADGVNLHCTFFLLFNKNASPLLVKESHNCAGSSPGIEPKAPLGQFGLCLFLSRATHDFRCPHIQLKHHKVIDAQAKLNAGGIARLRSFSWNSINSVVGKWVTSTIRQLTLSALLWLSAVLQMVWEARIQGICTGRRCVL